MRIRAQRTMCVARTVGGGWHTGQVTYTSLDTERWVAEPPKRPERTQFQRDRARVLHSSALRRLAAKTQVMRAGSADFPRTRLTHSLEVAQIGRDLGAVLGCDPDLVDAAGLAHALGHPPFGHNGESALAALADPAGPLACGAFEGEAPPPPLLPPPPPAAAGGGGAPPPHTTPLHLPPKYGAYQSDLAVFEWIRAAAPGRRRCLEAQVMDWADDVAYSVHDLEDGLHAGLVALKNLKDYSERALVSAVARSYYCGSLPDVTTLEIKNN